MMHYALRKNQQRLLSSSNNEQMSAQQRSFAVSRVGAGNAKDWLDEIFDFTSILSRRMQYTLGRIKMDFMRKGLKFDTDFRDHFLFIVNNRLIESFDSFLIQTPREMRSSDISFNRSSYAPSVYVPSIEPRRSSKGAKRKRPNSYRPSVNQDQSVNGSPEKIKRLNGKIQPAIPMVTLHTKFLQASKSDKSSSLSKSVTTNGYKESVQIEVSKVTETSTLTSLAMMKMNKNQTLSSTKPAPSTPNTHWIDQRDTSAYQNTNPKLPARTLSLMNVRERQIALSKYPMVRIPKILINSAGQVVQKSVSSKFKEVAKEKQNTRFNNNVNKDRATVATDHDYFLPKSQEKQPQVTKTPVVSRQLSANSESSSVPAGTVMSPTRFSERSRPKITYECEGCDYFSDVKNNYDRHLLLFKSCMAATLNKNAKTLTPKLKMIKN